MAGAEWLNIPPDSPGAWWYFDGDKVRPTFVYDQELNNWGICRRRETKCSEGWRWMKADAPAPPPPPPAPPRRFRCTSHTGKRESRLGVMFANERWYAYSENGVRAWDGQGIASLMNSYQNVEFIDHHAD